MIKYKRVENTSRNAIFGLLLKIITILGAFITRTMIIRLLGIEYIGLDGLFASVLSFLNMAELGFSSAIVYKLYKPISEGDTDQVCALIKYYRAIYRGIGTVVLTLGLAVIPFLRFFVKGSVPPDVNLYVLYLIYLFNTVLSYFAFAYKTAILNAHQRNDLPSKVSSIAFLIKYLLQFVLLLLFRNYYCFVIVIPLTTLLANIGNAILAKKYYPQYVCRGEISDSDRKEVRSKVSALLFNKIGVAVINGSDNIVISSFLGLAVLGIYDSYYYIFNMLHGVMDVFHSGVVGGIGNSIVTESIDKNFDIFKRLSFVNYWIVGWCSICLACLYEPFINIWIGTNSAFPSLYSVIMALYFYFYMIRFIIIIFKNAQGMWWEDRYRALLEGIFNLFLNVLMVQIIGIYGVTLSTIIAMLIISIPWETRVLFKGYFKRITKDYFTTLLVGTLVMIAIGSLTFFVCNCIHVGKYMDLIIRACICLIVPNLLLCIIYWKNNYRKYLFGLGLRFIRKTVRK